MDNGTYESTLFGDHAVKVLLVLLVVVVVVVLLVVVLLPVVLVLPLPLLLPLWLLLLTLFCDHAAKTVSEHAAGADSAKPLFMYVSVSVALGEVYSSYSCCIVATAVSAAVRAADPASYLLAFAGTLRFTTSTTRTRRPSPQSISSRTASSLILTR